MKVGFIGLGNMATAMIAGMIKKNVVESHNILGSSRTKDSVKKIVDAYGITGVDSNLEVAKQADVLVLSVKPQMYEDVIKEIKDLDYSQKVVISIAPGKTLEWLASLFEKKDLKLVRCMPNTPALVGEGCTGVCFSKAVTEDEKAMVAKLLNSFGLAEEVNEKQMDAVVGVSGSSPAYVFMFIEAMADAAVRDGMPRKQAITFAAQAVLGSAKMVLETGKHPGELKDMVCSPGGTTIEAVSVLEKNGFRGTVMEAQRACSEKSKNM